MLFNDTGSYQRPLASPFSFIQAWDWHCQDANSGRVPSLALKPAMHIKSSLFLASNLHNNRTVFPRLGQVVTFLSLPVLIIPPTASGRPYYPSQWTT